jgi:uncharacterized membrane protein YeaQ/YmgE (transglycosylase-associated protein family)
MWRRNRLRCSAVFQTLLQHRAPPHGGATRLGIVRLTGGSFVDLIWTIVIGFIAGLVAKMLTPGAGPGGFFLTAALGIGGSLTATYLGRFFGLYAAGQSAGFIAAVIGAVVLLLGYHLIAKK